MCHSTDYQHTPSSLAAYLSDLIILLNVVRLSTLFLLDTVHHVPRSPFFLSLVHKPTRRSDLALLGYLNLEIEDLNLNYLDSLPFVPIQS